MHSISTMAESSSLWWSWLREERRPQHPFFELEKELNWMNLQKSCTGTHWNIDTRIEAPLKQKT